MSSDDDCRVAMFVRLVRRARAPLAQQKRPDLLQVIISDLLKEQSYPRFLGWDEACNVHSMHRRHGVPVHNVLEPLLVGETTEGEERERERERVRVSGVQSDEVHGGGLRC